ncbi:diguanylate cyclase [Pseudocitrobacter faecalis]|uniref:diguanylate cyclase n=1 Tax=Pseudocitrobacter faecalis TaxID=1398493 RepID=UPI00167A6E62|nr:diguanylate cyclase [Pseudocitrobacter faecalis]GHD91401.1 diguanylate cyclase [Pseudocitrobacter faecalis]
METYLQKMKDEWAQLITDTDPQVRLIASEIAREHAKALSQEFYSVVLSDSQAAEFLTNDQVERQLKSALEQWIIDVFSCPIDGVDQQIQVQQRVADVHARIGIPVDLIEMGFRVLKKLLFPVIGTTEHSADLKLGIYHFAVNSIDLAMEVMSRAFIFSENSAAKEDENYRIFSLMENVEEEKERQVASLLSWEMDLIYKVMLDAGPGNSLPLGQSDFGLWFNHKGRHYFSGIAEAGHISRLIIEFDDAFRAIRHAPQGMSTRQQRVNFILQTRNTLSQIVTLLRELFEEVSRHEVGMDVLTRLLNRRFLPTIFKREIAHAGRAGTPMSILLIDVDKFKQINDTWGHNTGDDVLRKVAGAFYEHVRTSDFVFRYGGDEFLILLTEANEADTLRIAERVRSRVEKIKVSAPNGENIPLSLSIGAAMFSGHPDYERLIQLADEALYGAKRRGRNCVEMWKASC